ncbi:MAG: elongation factor G [Spirochaetes bacterium]|nr:elongation factor G [Spirochaetota bacterium]
MLKEYQTGQIRNVVIVGHSSTGKSTLLDAMLYAGGKIDKIGNPQDGTLTSDFDEEEKKRHMSIKSGMGFVEFEDVKINIIDTPGLADFVGEVRAGLQVAEAAIILVDSSEGVQIETEKVYRYISENKIPSIFFINKMDKERADYFSALQNIKAKLNANTMPLAIPIGESNSFSGLVDILKMKAVTLKGDGKDVQVSAIPDNLTDTAEEYKMMMTELSAEGDDALIEKFLDGGALTDDEVLKGIRSLLCQAKVAPVVCGSAIKATGVKTLLEIIKNFVPAPAIGQQFKGHNPNDASKEVVVESLPDKYFSAIVWKTNIDQYAGRFNYMKVISGQLLPDSELLNTTKNARERVSKLYTIIGNKQYDIPNLSCGDIGIVVKLEKTSTGDTLCDPKHSVVLPIIKLPHPVFSYAIETPNKADEDKVSQVFHKITDENPTINFSFNAETKETVLAGMGEMQLDIILKSIAEKNKIEIKTRVPRIAYKETITKKAESQYKHKKQSGGHGQYGEVYIRVAPLKRGQGFEFKDSIVGGVIPRQYIPGVEKGLREGLDEGVLAKFPLVDIWVELYYGSYHDVDSSEMSFKIAGRNALKLAVEAAGPQLLEPIMEVTVYVDKEFTGDILNDITSRRGRVLGMGGGEDGGSSSVKANVPLAEMLKYSIDLRSITSGKGSFEMKFSHYDPISGKIAEKVIEERLKHLEEEANK